MIINLPLPILIDSWNPSNLSGLSLYYDGREITYSDSSNTVISNAPTGRVRKVFQPLPLSGFWSASSDAVRPVRTLAGIECMNTPGGMGLIAPALATAVPGNNATIGVAFTLRQYGLLAGAEQNILDADAGGNVWGPTIGSSPFNIKIWRGGGLAGGTAWNTGIVPIDSVSHVMVIRYKTDNTIDIISKSGNDAEVTLSNAATLEPSNIGGTIRLGYPGIWNLHAEISQLILASGACSDADRTQLLNWLLNNKTPNLPPVDAPLLIVSGDSISAGTLNNPSKAWPYLLLDNLYTSNPNIGLRLCNQSVSGRSLEQSLIDYPTKVFPLIDTNRVKNRYVVCSAVNSLANETADVAFATLANLCQTARSDGAHVTVTTALNSTNTGLVGVNYNSRQTAFNDAIRNVALTGGIAFSTSYAQFADAIADIQAVPEAADPTNTTYFIDGLHPTDLLHTFLRPVIQTAVSL